MNPNNQHHFLGNDRNYPTTPSTFPQPTSGNGAGSNPYGQQPLGYNNPNSYFDNYAQHQLNQHYQELQPPPSTYQQPQAGPRSNASPNSNYMYDGTASLAHQFSHQHLGADGKLPRSPRQGPQQKADGRNGPPGQHLGVPASSSFGSADLPGDRNSDQYHPRVREASRLTQEFTSNWFREMVGRARDRNVRQKQFDELTTAPGSTDARKLYGATKFAEKEAQYLRFTRTKSSPNDFITIKVIGKGAFGEVRLVQAKADGKIYALKSLIKAEMFKKDQLAHVRAERDILAEADTPWVVKMFTSFQDEHFLYLQMEFLPGGDLMTMLIKYEIFSEDVTRFYGAEMIEAIAAVHKLGFIHRDIKPDNILLDKQGHVKLTDFGLSTGFHKLHDQNYYQQLLTGTASRPRNRDSVALDQINLTVNNRTQVNTWRKQRRQLAFSTVGTPDYIAPEIFTPHGYTKDCDWWSMGTILFECLVGWPPFCAEDVHETYRKIVDWRKTLHFPDDCHLSPEAKDLVRGLVCNSEQRLGHGGPDEIRDHPFFRGVDWKRLRTIRAPFEPQLRSNVDVSYFPIDEIEQTPDAPAVAKLQAAGINPTYGPEMSLPFVGYTYKRFDRMHSGA